MKDAETGIIDVLRHLIERRKIKLTALARDTGIPYRSLQNYLSKKSRLPLPAYLKICSRIGITPDYPVIDRFKIAHHALQQAIIDVMGPLLDAVELDEDSRLSIRPSVGEHDPHHVPRVAGFLAAMIDGRYDILREMELDEPGDDDKDEPDKVRQ
jgi:hypothetical protein